MAVGKNKRLTKGKKGGKKKVVDPFTRKEWYDVKVPGAVFNKAQIGYTCVNKTAGQRTAREGLMGRVFQASLADLNQGSEGSHRTFKFKCVDVQASTVMTNFHGMEFTRDKLCSLIKKWQTMIEGHVDVKTTDGYLMRIFIVAFTAKSNNQVKKTCYAQHQKVRMIRQKMIQHMKDAVEAGTLKQFLLKLVPGFGAEMEKKFRHIFPLKDVNVRKIKMLKAPKIDHKALMDLHNSSTENKESTKIAVLDRV